MDSLHGTREFLLGIPAALTVKRRAPRLLFGLKLLFDAPVGCVHTPEIGLQLLVEGDAGGHAVQPGRAGRHLRRARAQPYGGLLCGPLRQGSRPDAGADRGPARARPAAAGAGVRALLPALLALRNTAAVLRQTVLVHRHLAPAGRAAGSQRDRAVASAPRQARSLRGLVEEQRRLGALARALLGNAAAGVALR